MFAVIAIPIVGFLLHACLLGRQAMMPEFQIWLVYGLAATGVVFISLFVWNLACAPYRIERERAESLVAERDHAVTSLTNARDAIPPKLSLMDANIRDGDRIVAISLASIRADGEDIMFEKLKSIHPLDVGKTYIFQNLTIDYAGCNAESSVSSGSVSSRTISEAKFKIERRGNLYVEKPS